LSSTPSFQWTREQIVWGAVLVGAVALLGGTGILALRSDDRAVENPSLFRVVFPENAEAARRHKDIFSRVPQERLDVTKARRQEAIEEYLARIEARKDPPNETADMLFALGTLYRQEQDFQNASWAFEQITRDYPDSPKFLPAWLELLTCYEVLDNTDAIRRTCMDMMKVFPPDSDAYRLAENKLLKSKDLEIPDPLPVPQNAGAAE